MIQEGRNLGDGITYHQTEVGKGRPGRKESSNQGVSRRGCSWSLTTESSEEELDELGKLW